MDLQQPEVEDGVGEGLREDPEWAEVCHQAVRKPLLQEIQNRKHPQHLGNNCHWCLLNPREILHNTSHNRSESSPCSPTFSNPQGRHRPQAKMVPNLRNSSLNSKSHLQLLVHHNNNNHSLVNNNLHNLNKCSQGVSLGHKDHKVHSKLVNQGLVPRNKLVAQDLVDPNNNNNNNSSLNNK